MRAVATGLPQRCGERSADRVRTVLLDAFERMSEIDPAGAYRSGSDPVVDLAIQKQPAFDAFSGPRKINERMPTDETSRQHSARILDRPPPSAAVESGPTRQRSMSTTMTRRTETGPDPAFGSSAPDDSWTKRSRRGSSITAPGDLREAERLLLQGGGTSTLATATVCTCSA